MYVLHTPTYVHTYTHVQISYHVTTLDCVHMHTHTHTRYIHSAHKYTHTRTHVHMYMRFNSRKQYCTELSLYPYSLHHMVELVHVCVYTHTVHTYILTHTGMTTYLHENSQTYKYKTRQDKELLRQRAARVGFEPTTHCLLGRCSNH